jgi:hypothetical protein
VGLFGSLAIGLLLLLLLLQYLLLLACCLHHGCCMQLEEVSMCIVSSGAEIAAAAVVVAVVVGCVLLLLVVVVVFVFGVLQIPTAAYSGSRPLALPKLNLQFLSPADYLLRNFHLFRLEAAYEVREDVQVGGGGTALLTDRLAHH